MGDEVPGRDHWKTMKEGVGYVLRWFIPLYCLLVHYVDEVHSRPSIDPPGRTGGSWDRPGSRFRTYGPSTV